MEGVEGFKKAGNNQKIEIKLPQRSEELFLAWDVFGDDGPKHDFNMNDEDKNS